MTASNTNFKSNFKTLKKFDYNSEPKEDINESNTQTLKKSQTQKNISPNPLLPKENKGAVVQQKVDSEDNVEDKLDKEK